MKSRPPKPAHDFVRPSVVRYRSRTNCSRIRSDCEILIWFANVSQAAKKKALETLFKKLKEMLAEQEKADRRAARAATAAGAGLPPAR